MLPEGSFEVTTQNAKQRELGTDIHVQTRCQIHWCRDQTKITLYGFGCSMDAAVPLEIRLGLATFVPRT